MDYYKLLKDQVIVREWMIEDIENNSIVEHPANETFVDYFAAATKEIHSVNDIKLGDLNLHYRWVLGNNKEHCPSCDSWAKAGVKTLKTWIETALPRTPVGVNILNLTVGGKHSPYNTFCEQDCQCYLELAPNWSLKGGLERNIITFSAFNEEKHTIRGLVMRSGQWIPRNNVDGQGNPGYCYFSKETVKKMKDKFYSNKLTINHRDDITGDCIMTNSWLEKGQYPDKKEYIDWNVEYKVLTRRLWDYVKTNKVGFSIEAYFSAVKLSNQK